MKNLILIAPPATGKGTLAKALKERYGYIHISTGDMLRESVAKGDELGQKISDIMKSGALVPDEIIYELLEAKLQSSDGYILDGFPRNLEQAKKYEEIVANIGGEEAIVLVLDIDKEKLKTRCTGRRSCPKCGRIYNIYNPEMNPKDDKYCLDCGSEVIWREDDKIETFEKRYSTYLELTEPLIEYYSNKGNLYRINAGGTSGETLNEALKILGLGE